MPSLKRPDLPEGPKKELNTALHELHLRAGLPSVRDLVRRVGGKVVSGRSRIHDAFSSERLPAWGLVQILVEALTKTIPGADPAHEERRLHQLWLKASGYPTLDQPTRQLAPESPQPRWESDYPTAQELRRPVLAMRVEWAKPAELDVDTRRNLRGWVDRALDDIGRPADGEHRGNFSAGSTIVLNYHDESPNLTLGVFLAALDAEIEGLMRTSYMHSSFSAVDIRFMANFDPATVEPEATMDELDSIWSAEKIANLARQTNERISAVVHGIDIREGQLAGEWEEHYAEADFRVGQRGVQFYCRTSKANLKDPWSSPF
ncbi:hypothetical protein [Streptomyces mirabilis]|uniref:Uncharacterized protein n=1 Tax=Streptomyces mirabilis TaxID=68239 RepID=A0A1I2QG17_9ACTN|nr:hypothetical protein [Streptomyces mirabilis]SFG27515.1 hypothetical protein SAMN02787118_11836 [Streptomyces mirabilis]